MNRDEFLKNDWRPYPPAERASLDVAEFIKAGARDGAVCGRMDGSSLISNGARIEVGEWELLRDGDLVSFRFLSGAPQSFTLLAPSLKPYALRSSFDVETSHKWNSFTRSVREFFRDRDFTETFTPTLVPSPGTEPYLDPFATRWELGSAQHSLYLPTSPEFHLKQMLVAGWTRLFEIKTCFRNGEVGDHHEPEFHMLEWYRAYNDLDSIADDVAALLQALAPDARPLVRTTMVELFSKAFPGFALRPNTTLAELRDVAREAGISLRSDDSWDDIFFRLFLEKIEPGLGTEGPLLVRGYPPAQAALARIGPDGFADRFEVYWKGMELANAFHELNDPVENEARFRADAERKSEIGKPAVPVDENLVDALYHGLPPSGGIALGLERLFMAIHDLKEIGETRAFPIKR